MQFNLSSLVPLADHSLDETEPLGQVYALDVVGAASRRAHGAIPQTGSDETPLPRCSL
jgi:hypothetical protein